MYQQTYRGLPVLNGWHGQQLGADGQVAAVTDARQAVPASVPTAAAVHTAKDGAKSTTPQKVIPTELGVLGGDNARLVWEVVSTGKGGSVTTLVDATTEQTLRVTPEAQHHTGTGHVFDPNPVVALKNQSLTDKNDAGAIGEGFGDYLAVTMSIPDGKGYESACVMDWDAISYTSTEPHCLRRTNTDKTTDDIVGEVHDNSEIWSAALWDIQQKVGRTKADTLIVEAQFGFAPDTTFKAAALKTIATAQALYGQQVANKVKAAFDARKILR